ncbi:hypothetical protein H4R99_004593 [Coemansia sp. RSA 1722]|nr:hypothetical protein IWW45_001601 [Coemansia sp. RSA 485]KAJ2597223.1 hypothetical protein H4R99_004593 [Coemansia sp. RSA 1722]
MENNSDSNSDRDKTRLICLDTESSICLAFDKSLYSSRILEAMAEHRTTVDPSISQDIHMVPATGSSSETHFIPRVHEVNGSSDSQQKITSVAESTVGIKANSSSTANSNNISVMTADMAYAGDTEDYLQGVSDADTEMDRELQDAVDMVLNGEVADGREQRSGRRRAFYTSNGILGSARLLTGKLFKANGSSLVPVDNQQQQQQQQQLNQPGDQQIRDLAQQPNMTDVPMDNNETPAQSAQAEQEDGGSGGYFKRINLKGLLASARLARNRNNSPVYSEGGVSMSSLEKEATERKITGVVPDPSSKHTVRAACCLPEPVANTPFQGNRFLRPVVRFMQKRPMASLGIALTALVVLLVVIIVVLVVCVFPFLMRTTLQDVSVVLTQVHAVPPPEVARDLVVDTTRATRELGSVRHGRADVEPLELGLVHGFGAKEHWAREIAMPPVSSIVRNLMISAAPSGHRDQTMASFLPAHNQPMGHEAISTNAHHASGNNHLRHETVPNSIATASSHHLADNSVPSSGQRRAPIEDVVTLTSILMNTVHIAHPTPAIPSIAHLPSPAEFIPTTAHHTASKPLDTVKDVAVASTSYMMQLAGNLTSGGPIGVSIEFTEPLRLLWRDVEVGVISHPEKIHIPGRGTTQFTWPPFEVIVPGGLNQMQVDDRVLAQPASHAPMHSNLGIGLAQRRNIGGGSVPVLGKAFGDVDGSSGIMHEGLTNWFSAIQAHVPFTMQWRSRVKLSAMGLHTSDILFDKTVNIVCGESRNCTIDGSAFTTKN